MKLRLLSILAMSLSTMGFADEPALDSAITTKNWITEPTLTHVDVSRFSVRTQGLLVESRLIQVATVIDPNSSDFKDSFLRTALNGVPESSYRSQQDDLIRSMAEEGYTLKQIWDGSYPEWDWRGFRFVKAMIKDTRLEKADSDQTKCLSLQLKVLKTVLSNPKHVRFIKEMKVDQVYVTVRDFRHDPYGIAPRTRKNIIKDGCVLFNVDAVLDTDRCHIVSESEINANLESWEADYDQRRLETNSADKEFADTISKAEEDARNISEILKP